MELAAAAAEAEKLLAQISESTTIAEKEKAKVAVIVDAVTAKAQVRHAMLLLQQREYRAYARHQLAVQAPRYNRSCCQWFCHSGQAGLTSKPLQLQSLRASCDSGCSAFRLQGASHQAFALRLTGPLPLCRRLRW